MTRILSELLQAPEPGFRLGLRQLERVNGNPSTDIRLTAEVLQRSKLKLRELGLDPHDTTGEELYHSLLERVSADDKRLERALRTRAATHLSAEADVMAGMVHALQHVPVNHTCFALKSAVVKTLLKKQAPKRAMKQLGYRSLDSMLRNETPAAVLGAALLTESAAWRRSWIDSYKRLRASDFETRAVTISYSRSERWQALAQKALNDHHHSVLGLKELGTIVLLPLPTERPAALLIATLTLALHELNDIQAASSFLKLSQVRADFATRVQTVAAGQPSLSARLLDQTLPWHLVQRYYARAKQVFQDDLFGPHVQATDFHWQDVEQVLGRIAPSLEFWEHTPHLSLLHDHQPVSFNLMDVAVSCCNKLQYANRSLQHAQAALWNELTLRYLNHENIEQAVSAELQPQLATEPALI